MEEQKIQNKISPLKLIAVIGLSANVLIFCLSLFIGLRAHWADPSEVEWLVGSFILLISFVARRRFLVSKRAKDTSLTEYGWISLFLFIIGLTYTYWWVTNLHIS